MKRFGECYGVYLFGIYLLLNILDWLTGWYKARVKKETSSKAGLKGIVKKVGYWVILLIAFLIPYMFRRLGKDLLDIDLSYLSAMGWFTLANLLVNEIRSILENLIACGYRVPDVLKRGLEITEKVINEKKK
ncbi:phage holin family protein [Fusicatenibacter sp. CLA-AA-H213]|mgnify:FL=1|nr:phage holin family protein [Fusicatenibacter sp. CLA-AA-H213]